MTRCLQKKEYTVACYYRFFHGSSYQKHIVQINHNGNDSLLKIAKCTFIIFDNNLGARLTLKQRHRSSYR